MINHFSQRLLQAIYLSRHHFTQQSWLLLSFLIMSFILILRGASLSFPTLTARIDLFFGQFIVFHAVLDVK